MEFRYTDDEKLLQKTIRALAREKIGPLVPELEKEGQFAYKALNILKQAGLLSLHVPVEFGGTGGGVTADCLILEELARIYPSAAITLIPNTIVNPLIAQGNEKYRSQLRGKGKLLAICLTEPNAGSDAASIKTRAERKGDVYAINGTKSYVTNGGVADLYCVVTVTDPKKGVRGGVTNLLVEPDTAGFSVSRVEEKMGLHGSQTAQLVFEDVEVPLENMVGEEGNGFRDLMSIFDGSRIGVGAAGVGIAQGALDLAVQYTKERVQFGKPIAEFQGIQFMLADLAMQMESARALTYKAAALFDAGEKEAAIPLASMSKCLGSDAGMRVAMEAVQIFGGYGYMRDYPVEGLMRDAKALQIFEGTNQIQRVIISRHLLR